MTRDAAVTRSLLAALLALVPGMATAADPPRPAAHRASQPATLVGPATVIDGDTLVVGPVHVRLWGVNAPEHDEPAGPAATAALAALVDGELVTCVTARQQRDRYGRWVGRCATRDTADLACALVASGHARDWPRYSRGFYRRCRP